MVTIGNTAPFPTQPGPRCVRSVFLLPNLPSRSHQLLAPQINTKTPTRRMTRATTRCSATVTRLHYSTVPRRAFCTSEKGKEGGLVASVTRYQQVTRTQTHNRMEGCRAAAFNQPGWRARRPLVVWKKVVLFVRVINNETKLSRTRLYSG